MDVRDLIKLLMDMPATAKVRAQGCSDDGSLYSFPATGVKLIHDEGAVLIQITDKK